MTAYHVNKGYDLQLEGEAKLELSVKEDSQLVAVNPSDIKDTKYKLLVREGDEVKVGSALATTKHDEEIALTSPVAGKVKEVIRGERRALMTIIIEVSNTDDAEDFGVWDSSKVASASSAEIVSHLKKSGLWPLLRQRPFDTMVDAEVAPKAIFVNGMDSAPNGVNQEFALRGQESEFALGLAAIANLADCKTHLCYAGESNFSAFVNAEGVEKATFTGKHPKGLVGTHIYHVSPLNKGETVWHISAQNVALIGSLLSTGKVPSSQVVCVTGANVEKKGYFKVLRGAILSDYVQGVADNSRVISGNVLAGEKRSLEQSASIYSNHVTVIPEGDTQYYLLEDKHWAMTGFERFTLWNLFMSRLAPKNKKWNLDTNRYGDVRGIVTMDAYDKYVAQDIYVNFLAKSILSQDIERMEKLGLYELAPEDVALCTFVCPSKTDFSAIVEQGLDLLRREG